RDILFPQALDMGLASLQSVIVGLDSNSEAEIGERIFVGTEDTRRRRQGGEFAQRLVHLLGGALEKSSAPSGEQGVATKEPRLLIGTTGAEIGNMVQCMAGYVEHFEREPQQAKGVTFRNGVGD